MTNHFDEYIERRNTNSLKYDFAVERNRPADILPLWVADMDFRIAQPILEDLQSAISHGIFGYSEVKTPYFQAIHGWMQEHFGWSPKEDWLIKTPGVVFAIAMAIQAYTKRGDAVLIQQPVYYPFGECILDNGRKLVNSELIYENGYYRIDFDDFEKKIIENEVKLFLLCSPQNPTGRVWRREELTHLADICLRHHVIILSDEIHADFTYEGHSHIVFASLSEEIANQTITCTSPTKTFNIAGLQISNIFISNDDLRNKFRHRMDAAGYSQCNAMGLIAAQSAYTRGEPWYQELKTYLAGNLEYTRSFLREHIPEIKLIEPEGTYLVWLDCHDLGLDSRALQKFITNDAKLWLDGGYIFGKASALFERINIACPRSTLKQALEQLEMAVQTLR